MAKMILGLQGFPKRKRGNTVFRFESFCEPDYPTRFNGLSFEENIRAILGFGSLENVAPAEAKFWSFQLELTRNPPTIIRLFVVEEEVNKLSTHWCHYCRSIGWGGHLICNKRFHFVLPRREATQHGHKFGIEINGDRHLMHGLVHSNGFGHLITINGFAGGSEYISGQQVLDLWDRICTALRVRKISLLDKAERDNMELRLIYGVAFGKTWFSQWGYVFARPTYGVTYEMYIQSLATLQSFPLYLLVPHFGKEIPFIIAKYQTISNQQLVTLGDLFKFMLEFKSRLPFHSLTPINYHGLISESTSRWSAKRVEMAARVIVDALKRSETRWVTRQEVRDTARAYIGDTGLLDFVLKSLGNHIVGNYVVRRMVNPVTKVLEYCLEDFSNVNLPPTVSGNNSGKNRVRLQMTKSQVVRDLSHLYRNILMMDPGQGVRTNVSAVGTIPVAVRMVLDTKQFVKNYQEGQAKKINDVRNQDCVNINCTIRIRNGDTYPFTKEVLPYENMSLSIDVTIGELKADVQRHFRKKYFGLNCFVAESLVGFNGLDSCSFYSSIIGLKGCVMIEGRLDQMGVNEVFEGGDDNIVVKCGCGALDEDGERLICCDICEVWQHSRCAGVLDCEEIPRVFLCNRCENDIVSLCPINF